MANPEHVEIVKQGAEALREWQVKIAGVELDLSQAYLPEVDLSGANLRGADLCEADLRGAYLDRADLRGADFVGANLSQAELVRADLTGAHLSGANLSGAYLARADASRADFTRADLGGADLSGATVIGANFRWADLSEAHLRDVYLRATDLTGADLDKAIIGSTGFGGLDLSVVRGLKGISHFGASTVGVDTLEASKGQIPDRFLRGCGFAPWQILEAKLYDPEMTAAQISDLQDKIFNERTHGRIHFGGVFISYAGKDFKFVDKISSRLRKQGAPVWEYRHNMTAGPKQKQLNRAIRKNDAVLLILSEASMKSDWVEAELDIARRKERDENRDVICPVALDQSWKAKVLDDDNPRRDLWLTLEQKIILDLSDWENNDEFERQFQKLVRGLKVFYPPRSQ